MASCELAAEVGSALKAARTAKGQSLRSVARAMGKTDPPLVQLEHGMANPTLKRLEEVARAYGVRLRLTVERTGKPDMAPGAGDQR